MSKFLYFLLVTALMFAACSERDKPEDEAANDNNDTTQLTKGVLFSAVMLNDYLQLEDDEDLGVYLETEIYPLVANSRKVSMERIAPAVYGLTYDSAGQTKSLIIERFYNPKEERVFFEKSPDSDEADTTDSK
jgi:hypothetical protein